jgi:murein DD-endopeptidase MepM/ murein hydrolase activator NlpD
MRIPAVLPPLSSTFGYRLHPIRGTYTLHSGIDIPGHAGTPIVAAGPGTVRFAGWAGGYGNLVEIDHGNGIETRYGHLSRILVRAGAPVSTGQQIALMGSTGMSTGNHLHFEVRNGGRATNPLPYFGRDVPAFRFAARSVARLGFGASAASPDATPHLSKFAQAAAARRRVPQPGL